MIGTSEKSWNWLHSVVVPTLLAGIEAAWVLAWINALAQTTPHVRLDLSYLTLALPAILATVVTGCTARLPWPTWCRIVLLIPLAVFAIAISAGVIATVALHGSFATVSAHPWTSPRGTPSAVAALSLFMATIAWARGISLGWEELTLRHVAFSVGLATIAIIAFFAVGAIPKTDITFHDDLKRTVVLLLVSFPIAIAVIALVNEREIERHALRHQRSRPDPIWLGAVIIPMIGVGVIALLLALAIGPLAPVVARVLKDLARGIGAVLGALARWLAHFFHAVKQVPKGAFSRTPRGVRHTVPVGHLPLWVSLLAAAIGALAVAVFLFVVVRGLLRLNLRPRRRRRIIVEGFEEERESVFSWGHLLEQLRGLFRNWFGRRPKVPVDLATSNEQRRDLLPEESVRHHYRRILGAARSTGHGRRACETPFELEIRLRAVGGESFEDPLRAITDTYERARYGAEPESPAVLERVRTDATTLVTALRDAEGETSSPDAWTFHDQ